MEVAWAISMPDLENTPTHRNSLFSSISSLDVDVQDAFGGHMLKIGECLSAWVPE